MQHAIKSNLLILFGFAMFSPAYIMAFTRAFWTKELPKLSTSLANPGYKHVFQRQFLPSRLDKIPELQEQIRINKK